MSRQRLFFIIIAAAVSCCCGCASSEDELMDLQLEGGLIKNADTESANRKQEILSSQRDLDTEDPEVMTFPPDYTTEDNIVSFGEPADMGGISYTPLSYEITREFGERKFDSRLLDWVTRDDQGNLTTEGETYIFVTLRITNNTEETATIARDQGRPYYMDNNDAFRVCSIGETAYIDEWWTGGSLSELAFWELAPGESITCEVGYWLNADRPENTTLYYGFERYTGQGDDSDSRFYLMEEE